jgi:hypothetical protein
MPTDPNDISFREIYPTLTEGELKEAQENLRRYIEIAWEIQNEKSSTLPEGAVDSSRSSTTMKERSNASLKK